MPLDLPSLTSGLADCFADPPESKAACARAWADAAVAFAAGVVPASTTVTTAGDALAAALTSAFEAPNAVPAMELAFTQFGAAVGLGMAGYAPVPPVAPVGFGPQFAGPKPATHQVAADSIGGLVNTWMKTGVSTLVAPPNTPVPWS